MRVALLFVCAWLFTACGPDSEGVLKLRELAADDDPIVPADADAGNPSLCSTANVALCDGFETTPVQSPPWSFITSNGSVTLDTTNVYRGTQALHVQLTDALSDTLHTAELQESVVVPSPRFYMRVFVYIASTAPQFIVRLASLGNAGSPSGAVSGSLMLSDATPLLTASDGTGRALATKAIPLGTWTCLGWDVDLAAGRARVLVNDEAVAELALKQGASLSVASFDFGLAFTSSNANAPPLEIWYDEIAIDPEPVGCDR